jgi:PPOX class probable F420-dependent enzyme
MGADMDLAVAFAWAATRTQGILITLRADGRAQSSDISYFSDGSSMLISLTLDRAKTKNMQRDPRVVLHVTDRPSWSYLSFDGHVELTPVTAAIDDAVNDQLFAYYEAVAGKPHPNWAEYRQAMVDEGRLLARVVPTSVVGQINTGR